jgi:ubiquinone/menaquinone biosynthesis C-methylase UbiE
MTDRQRQPICDYDGSDYQDRFWDRGGRDYEDQVEGVALARLLPTGGKRLLEVGAGAGRNTVRYGGFQQIVLFDYSRTQMQQAQQRLGRSSRYLYVVGDAYHLPFQHGVFDCATMIRTLHHIAEPTLVLAQIRESLHQGAIFILEYANKQNLKAIIRWILRRQAWSPFDRESVEFAPINFNFHPVQVRQWLVETDFEIERQLTVSHFRLDLLKRIVPTRILVGMDALVQRTGSWWQLSPSVFVRSKASGNDLLAAGDSIFRCPACDSSVLDETEDGYRCVSCGRLWERKEGLIDFRDSVESGKD